MRRLRRDIFRKYQDVFYIAIWVSLIAGAIVYEKGQIDPKTGKTIKTLPLNLIQYFNPHLQLALITLYWGALSYVFEKCEVPYQVLLVGDNHIAPVTYIKYSKWMLYLIGGTSLSYAYAILFGLPEQIATVFPATLYGAGLLYVLYYITPSFHFTYEMMRRTFIPSQHLRFQDMFYLDIFTSFTKDLGDFMLAVCSMMNLWGWSAANKCGSTWFTTGVSCAPLIVGMCQCFMLFCYPQPVEQPQPQNQPRPRLRNMCNGFRQVLIIGIMILAELYNHVNAKLWSGMLIWFWVAFLALYTALSIFWDIVYDWNLRVKEWILCGLPTFPTWLFAPRCRWIYYLIVVLDALLRAAWGFRISNYSSVPLNFGLSFAEFGRRMIWIPLRIDDELRKRNILPPPPEQEMGEVEHQA